MVFDPDQFLVLARELCMPGRSEAQYRTVVSRAYYALYHRLPTSVKVATYGGGQHQSAVRRLREMSPEGESASYLLDTCLANRVIADYKLDRSVDHRRAQKQIDLVTSVIADLVAAGIIT